MTLNYSASRRSILALTGIAGLELISTHAFAQGANAARRAGVTKFVVGDASVSDADGKRVLANGDVVREGQVIETGPAAETQLVFDDGGYLALRPNSRLQIDKAQIAGKFSDNLTMSLLAGAMRSITGWIGKFDRNNYRLNTATATIGIRGTDHEVAIIAEGEARNGEVAGIHNWVNEGGTTLKNAGGSIDVDAAHAAWAGHNGQAPQAHTGIPAYLKQRKTKNEGRVNRHAQHITEHIETRMQKRGMLKPGEKLEDAQKRHHAEQSKNPQDKEKTAEQANPPKKSTDKEARVKHHGRAKQ